MKPSRRTSNFITATLFLAVLMAMLLAALSAACVTVVPRADAAPASNATTIPTPVPTPHTTPTPHPTSTPMLTPTPTMTIEDLLDVRGPENSAAVRSDSVVVHGYARADAVVQINDEPAPLDETNRFSELVDLSPGVNSITVHAETPDGVSETTTLSVISLLLPPQPFFLIITQPEDQSFVVHPTIPLVGRTTAGTTITVNGVTIPVDISGVFSTTVTLQPGANLIEVQGTSSSGEELNALRAVIYRE